MIVPLAVPLVAGPSAIAIVILFATTSPNQLVQWSLSVFIAWFITAIILISSEGLRRVLGASLLQGIERLMGLILTTLAVEMFLIGTAGFFLTSLSRALM